MENTVENASDGAYEKVAQRIVKKSDYIPLAEIIDKFHKIRESHMKDKHNIIYEHFRTESQACISVTKEVDKLSAELVRPNSARQGLCKQLKSEIGSSRRRSLPSIFHPGSVVQGMSSVDGDAEKQVEQKKKQTTPVGVSCGLNRRRFSLPYVIKEYAKEDLDVLESKLNGQKGDSLRDAATDDDDGERRDDRGINGKDLHAFYNMWKSRVKPTRKRIPRRLDAILREHDIDNGPEGRPRGFSF